VTLTSLFAFSSSYAVSHLRVMIDCSLEK